MPSAVPNGMLNRARNASTMVSMRAQGSRLQQSPTGGESECRFPRDDQGDYAEEGTQPGSSRCGPTDLGHVAEQSIGEHVQDDCADRVECRKRQPQNAQQTNVLTHPAAPRNPPPRRRRIPSHTCRRNAGLPVSRCRTCRRTWFLLTLTHFYYQKIRTTSEERSGRSQIGPTLLRKRKGHPATGGLFFQGRIVPTEI
jgi:hypothetical protein